MTKSINEAVARLKTIFNRCSNDYFKGLRSGSEVEAEFEAAVRTELAQPAPPMSGRAADLAHVWETIYDHGAGKHKGAASLAQRQKAIEILERMEQAVQPVIAQPKKPFPAPGRWFPIGVLDHPMREYMPGKWESAEWPSDYVPDREQPAQPMSGRAAASIKPALPLQDAKDAERLTFMVSRPPRYVESSKNGFFRVYQDHAADSDEHALWVAMTLDYYTSANGAIDAAIASPQGGV